MDRLRPFELDLRDPLGSASAAIDVRRGVLVRVGDDPPGIGEATPLSGWTEPYTDCVEGLRTALEADPSGDHRAALEPLEGLPAARHGLGLALADRDARRSGEPLYRALGGPARPEAVPVNATIGTAGVEATVAAARQAVDAGFDCLKLKAGTGPVVADLDRIAAVRETVGPGVGLRVDANGTWGRDEARRALDGLAALDVEYVEQPLEPADLDGHAALRGHDVGIALDESLVAASAAAVLEADAADVVVLKPMALGGIDRARAIAEAAQAAGVDPVVTTTVDAVVARTAAVHLAASLGLDRACGLATAGLLAEDLGPDPAPVRDGEIAVPRTAGTGVSGVWGP